MEKTLNQKRLEFLLDTANYYSEDFTRKSMVDTYCKYLADNGNKCAIGRHLPDDVCIKLDRLHDEHGGSTVDKNVVFNELPEWMQELGKGFLKDVQELHDYSLDTVNIETRKSTIIKKYELEEV